MSPTVALEIRHAVSLEIARYFHRHLLEELGKSPRLLDQRRADGLTAGEADRRVLGRLLAEFPQLPDLPPAPWNLIEEWARRNRFIFRYPDYSFDLYNRVFIERLLALHDPTPARLQAFREATLLVFGTIDPDSAGFSISFFLRVENNMRELLREVSRAVDGIDHEAAWRMLYAQSTDYQEVVNEVFERRLKAAIDESNRLLHNILPAAVAEELKKNDHVQPVSIESATVLFTDFVGFTRLAAELSPAELVRALDERFSQFDRIAYAHGLEKIKTIGDAYMCAGGLPAPNRTHAVDVALAALEMRDAMRRQDGAGPRFDVRIGFHTGPLVAGVIGQKKFSYDIWGDTVNTASRMESSGVAGRINTSAESHALLAPFFELTPRGPVEAKGKGAIPMYFLERIRPDLSVDEFRAAYDRLRGSTPRSH
jgi:class 3 adenylate cyclase